MIKRLKGTQDILPHQVSQPQRIEDISRREFELFGYREIRTPIIEETALFARSVGKETDIVSKQMYAFKDQGSRDICLRPEQTASVVRAYLENSLDKREGFVKLYYMGPMFRAERPQKGRLRQFHQIGVEVIGSYSVFVDAEIIILLNELLKKYSIGGYQFRINSLGCDKDKIKLKNRLKKELKPNLNVLCDDCKRRYKTNILRLLDCKNETCSNILRGVSLDEDLCRACSDEFNKLKKLLDEAGITYKVSPALVRGLDYYTNVVFEVTAEGLGAQDAIAAGGRYDNLVSDLGGAKTGACGFAIGIERIIEAVSKSNAAEKAQEERTVTFIVTIGDKAYSEGFKLLRQLRNNGIPSDIDFQKKSLKAQMRYADKINAKYVVLLGEDELKSGMATIKDMRKGSEEKISLPELVKRLS